MVKVLSLIIALFSITSLASININNESSEYSSSGNSFHLSNIKYEKEESFVYTATVNFISGYNVLIPFNNGDIITISPKPPNLLNIICLYIV